MIKKNKEILILFLVLCFQVITYFKISHLTWLPSYTNTWFYENGLVYYKDFIQAHLPLPHIISYPFYKATSWNLATGPFLALTISVLSLVILFIKGKKHLNTAGLIFALLHFGTLFWFASTWIQFTGESVIGLFLLLATFQILSISNSQSINYKNLILLGLTISLVELSGQIASLTVLVIIFISTYLVVTKAKDKKQTLKYLSTFALSGTFPLILLLLYFFFQNALSDFVFWNFTYYLTYANLVGPNTGSPSLLEIGVITFPAVLLFFHAFEKKKEKLKLDTNSTILIVILLSSLPLLITSIHHTHHLLYILPVTSLASGYAIKKILKSKSKHKKIYVLIAIFLSILLFKEVFAWYSSKYKQGFRLEILSDINRSPQQKKIVDWLGSHTSIGQKIIVVGDPLIYVAADRIPANSRYSVLPWHYFPLENTAKEFDKSPPDYFVIDANYIKRLETGWDAKEIADFILERVDRCYEKTFQEGPWSVWKNKCK